MKTNRSLFLHGGLLLLASALAYSGYTKSAPPAGTQRLEVQVWSGTPDQLSKIELEMQGRKVTLEGKQDKEGRYYVGELTREKRKPPTLVKADAGAEKPPEPKPESETVRFIAASSMEKLAEQLAPLGAYRSLGKIAEGQAADFGFDKPEGTLRVTVGGKTHALELGGTTPGGADRYVRDKDSGVAYAILGSITRDLENADSRLTERNLNGFEPAQVTRVRISVGNQTRELVPMGGNESAWADAESPKQEDETATNWMVKLGRLRPNRYVAEKPDPSATPVFAVEYFEGKKRIGELVLVSAKGEGEDSDGKTEYLVRTNHTRWYASVIRTTAEQLDQDLGSVVR
ncbi:MAG: DUF4340 domain-containing protein [Myxococcales bacterium]|nr:DUF4340 domain-containing protein [Myxococcales bacterium]